MSYGYSDAKPQYVNRVRRIEGQVRGIERMIADDQYCIDILTQIAAINKALQSVSVQLLQDHLNHCLKEAAHDPSDEVLQEKVAEATAAISRLLKS